jgi:hypothetical protein
LGLSEPAAVLELNEEFREAYSKDIVQVWYPSIDINFILFHVEFEDGLFILIWRERATRYKNWGLKIVKILKNK